VSGDKRESDLLFGVLGSGFLEGCSIHLRDPVRGVSITNTSPTVVSDDGQTVTGVFDLTCLVPGSYRIGVTNPDGQASGDDVRFVVSLPCPVVHSISPTSGHAGDSALLVSVTGSGFIEGCSIYLRDPVSGVSITNTSLTVVSDDGQTVSGVFDLTGLVPGSYRVVVTNPDGQESGDDVRFVVSLPCPVVHSVSPVSGHIRDSALLVSVIGSGFIEGCSIHLRDPVVVCQHKTQVRLCVSDDGKSVRVF
jgi:hypothetical protein